MSPASALLRIVPKFDTFFKCHLQVLYFEWTVRHYSDCVTFMLFYFLFFLFPWNTTVINDILIIKCHMMDTIWCYFRNSSELPVINNLQIHSQQMWPNENKMADSHIWTTKWYTEKFVINFVHVYHRAANLCAFINSSCALWQHNILIQVKWNRARLLSDFIKINWKHVLLFVKAK